MQWGDSKVISIVCHDNDLGPLAVAVMWNRPCGRAWAWEFEMRATVQTALELARMEWQKRNSGFLKHQRNIPNVLQKYTQKVKTKNKTTTTKTPILIGQCRTFANNEWKHFLQIIVRYQTIRNKIGSAELSAGRDLGENAMNAWRVFSVLQILPTKS